ncbi:MAG: DUF1674 domain-containing protein [Rhodospirillales bacterium]|nr:DUF1674 domain-containing protein [Rhodospirillales bacterium]
MTVSDKGSRPAPDAAKVPAEEKAAGGADAGGADTGGADQAAAAPLPREIGGAPGPEPTRYGDWQHKGRVTDF